MIYSRVIVQLGGSGNSLVCAAATVLTTTELHVGETLIKAIINIVANILGVLLGYGLHTFSEYEIGNAKFAFLIPVIFTMIFMGILLRFVKVVKDKYDYGTSTFLQAMLPATLHLLGPDLLNKEFSKNATTWGIGYALTVLSAFLPPFWAGADVHYRVQEYLNSLADIFKGLDEECFRENCTYENSDDKLFLQLLQSVIDSKEKEKSLSKFIIMEPWWHSQEQYEKIGDLSRHCASTIQSLSTYLTTENMHFSPELRETCKEICSESATALAHFSLSMKLKNTPAASINIHLTAVLNFASKLENMLEAKDITSRLVESVLIIKRLVDSIEELARLASFKQFEQDSNLSELFSGLGFPQQLIPAIQQEVAVRANQLVAPMKKLYFHISNVYEILNLLFAFYRKVDHIIKPMDQNAEAIIIVPAPQNLPAPISNILWITIDLIFLDLIFAGCLVAPEHLIRTFILCSILFILSSMSLYSANMFIKLDQERSVKALKWRWICAIEQLLMGSAYPACLSSPVMPSFHRIAGWIMFGINVVVTVIAHCDYLSTKGFGQSAVRPLPPDAEAVVDDPVPPQAAV